MNEPTFDHDTADRDTAMSESTSENPVQGDAEDGGTATTENTVSDTADGVATQAASAGDTGSPPETEGGEADKESTDDSAQVRRPNSMDPWVRYKQRSHRIREEIERNRRGDYTIPTWGLVLILLGLLAVWGFIIWLP